MTENTSRTVITLTHRWLCTEWCLLGKFSYYWNTQETLWSSFFIKYFPSWHTKSVCLIATHPWNVNSSIFYLDSFNISMAPSPTFRITFLVRWISTFEIAIIRTSSSVKKNTEKKHTSNHTKITILEYNLIFQFQAQSIGQCLRLPQFCNRKKV